MVTPVFKSEGVAVPPPRLGGSPAPARITDITGVFDRPLPAVLEALGGRVLTRGVARIRQSGAGWTARVSQMDRPGVIAAMFFSERARDVLLRLDDGRQARARIAGTSFLAASERVCDLTGTEPLT